MLLSGLGAALAGLALFYAGLFAVWTRGLRRVLARVLPPLPAVPPFVSVIVPARDEEGTIEACVASLLASDYPGGCFEVIVVDDFSRDATADRVAAMQRVLGGDVLRLIRLGERLEHEHEGHKGVALAWGVHDAVGKLILTTDADCQVSPGWIAGLVRTFDDARVGFVAGAVRLDPTGRRGGALQALEMAGFVGIGAGALEHGHPTLCNSAAIGYPRRVFEALRLAPRSPELPERMTPWDDELMLMRIADHPTLYARFCPDPAAVVTTHAEPSLGAFWRQRQRWAATGARYPGAIRGLVVRLIWVFYAGPARRAHRPALRAGALPVRGRGVRASRCWPNSCCSCPFCAIRGRCACSWWLVPGQLVQLPYIVVVSVIGFLRPPAWKGRRLQPPEPVYA